MDYIIVVIVYIILIGLGFIININYRKYKIKNVLKDLKEIGTLNKSISKIYDYDLIIEEEKYFVKFIYTKKFRELSFNSNSHWQLKPHRKLQLIDPNGFDNLEGNKIIIVDGSFKKIVKYLNENEIVFVKPLEKCFTYNVFLKDEINLIKELKKEA